MNSSVDLPAVTRPMRKLQNSMPLQSSVGEKSHRRRFFRPAAALGSPCEVRHFYQMYPPSSASPSSSSSSSASSPLSSFSSSSSHPTPLPPSPEYSATSSGTKKKNYLSYSSQKLLFKSSIPDAAAVKVCSIQKKPTF